MRRCGVTMRRLFSQVAALLSVARPVAWPLCVTAGFEKYGSRRHLVRPDRVRHPEYAITEREHFEEWVLSSQHQPCPFE